MGMIALGTVGAVAIAELGRLWRRRVVAEEPETAPELLQRGARAALDTVEVGRRGYIEAASGETILFNLLSAFVISSSLIRLTAFGKRRGLRPFFDVIVGRTHIHHFIPGIAIAFGSGAAALFARDDRLRETLAIPLGIGMGLTFDESALLLSFEDVYWSREGLVGIPCVIRVDGDGAGRREAGADHLQARDVVVDRQAGSHLHEAVAGGDVVVGFAREAGGVEVKEEAARVAVERVGAREPSPEIGTRQAHPAPARSHAATAIPFAAAFPTVLEGASSDRSSNRSTPSSDANVCGRAARSSTARRAVPSISACPARPE